MEIENLVTFCRALRERGLSVTPAEVVTAATVLQVIDTKDRDEVFLSLRSVLTTSVDDFPVFAELFEAFWNRSPRKLIERDSGTTVRARNVSPPKGLAFFLENWSASVRAGAAPVKVPGASDTASRAQKDFTDFSHEELEQISQLARRIVKRLASKPSRRWQPVARGHRVNLRRSLRLSLKTGGELIELAYTRRTGRDFATRPSHRQASFKQAKPALATDQTRSSSESATLASLVFENRRRANRSKLPATTAETYEAGCDLRRVRVDGHVQPAAVAVRVRTPE